jgi:hypothetical protein
MKSVGIGNLTMAIAPQKIFALKEADISIAPGEAVKLNLPFP